MAQIHVEFVEECVRLFRKQWEIMAQKVKERAKNKNTTRNILCDKWNIKEAAFVESQKGGFEVLHGKELWFFEEDLVASKGFEHHCWLCSAADLVNPDKDKKGNKYLSDTTRCKWCPVFSNLKITTRDCPCEDRSTVYKSFISDSHTLSSFIECLEAMASLPVCEGYYDKVRKL